MDCSSEDAHRSDSSNWNRARDPRTLSPLSSPTMDSSASSIEDAESQVSEGTSIFSTPVANYGNRYGDAALLNAPLKRTRPVSGLRDRSAGDSFTHIGEYGLEYVISWVDGGVILKVKDCATEWRLNVHEWGFFFENLCPMLDGVRGNWHAGTHVFQWTFQYESRIHRMDANYNTKRPQEFIFFRRCVDTDELPQCYDMHCIGSSPLRTSVLKPADYFDNVFFIQWADLSALRAIFAEIDTLAKTNEETWSTSDDEYRMRLFEATGVDEGVYGVFEYV
ncbi:unnamed protein product [Arctogadus glacialis]